MATINRAPDILAGRSTQTAPTITAMQMQSQRSSKNYLMMGIKGAAFVIGFLPGISLIAFPISWATDRFVNGNEAKKELKLRTKYYSEQIGKTLGMDPRNVTVDDFAQAAKINPNLRRLYDEPIRKQSTENRTSTLLNGGAMAAVGIIPGGLAAAHGSKAIIEGLRGATSVAIMAKSTAGALAGGALGSALSKESIETQELVEALEKGLAEADRTGRPRSEAINPQLIFMVRVSQDKMLEAQIKKQFGTALHKMSPEQINGVMATFPDLASAATREEYAITRGIMPVRDLAATAPNLQGTFAGGMVNRDNGTFVEKLAAQRAATQQQGVSA